MNGSPRFSTTDRLISNSGDECQQVFSGCECVSLWILLCQRGIRRDSMGFHGYMQTWNRGIRMVEAVARSGDDNLGDCFSSRVLRGARADPSSARTQMGHFSRAFSILNSSVRLVLLVPFLRVRGVETVLQRHYGSSHGLFGFEPSGCSWPP